MASPLERLICVAPGDAIGCALAAQGGPPCGGRCIYHPAELAAINAEPPPPPPPPPAARRVVVEVRGTLAPFVLRPGDQASTLVALALALLALDDPRIDAVLRTCGIVLTDAANRQVWP